MEMVWAGAITNSTIVFVSILQFWLNRRRPQLQELDDGHNQVDTTFQWNDDSVNLIFEFWRAAKYPFLDMKIVDGN
jgi:hypothetical protein